MMAPSSARSTRKPWSTPSVWRTVTGTAHAAQASRRGSIERIFCPPKGSSNWGAEVGNPERISHTVGKMRNYENFINGKFTPSTGTERITCINPSTGEAICTVPESTANDVEAAVSAAVSAQKSWAKRPAVERGLALRAIAAKIRENVEPLARLITEEQGKTLGLARVEVAFTADYMDYMAEWARRIEGEILESDRPGETILLFRQAIGVIGGILPWNFPFFLIARKAAPALITGNTIVLKPSEETPHNAVKFCELMAQTDLPPGVINI